MANFKYHVALDKFENVLMRADVKADAVNWAETIAKDYPGKLVHLINTQSGEVDYYRVPDAPAEPVDLFQKVVRDVEANPEWRYFHSKWWAEGVRRPRPGQDRYDEFMEDAKRAKDSNTAILHKHFPGLKEEAERARKFRESREAARTSKKAHIW